MIITGLYKAIFGGGLQHVVPTDPAALVPRRLGQRRSCSCTPSPPAAPP